MNKGILLEILYNNLIRRSSIELKLSPAYRTNPRHADGLEVVEVSQINGTLVNKSERFGYIRG